MTTTGKHPPSSVSTKVLTSTTPCPKQLLIVPGFEIGRLYLGMTLKNANSPAKLVTCGKAQRYPVGITAQLCLYDEASKVGGEVDLRAGLLPRINGGESLKSRWHWAFWLALPDQVGTLL